MTEPETDPRATGMQPFLHDLVTCLNAPAVALSSADGQIRPSGAQGVFAADLRVLATAEITVDGRAGEPISAALDGARAAVFLAAVRRPGGATPDPTSWLHRRRSVRPDGMDELIELENVSETTTSASLRLTVATDLVDMETVKHGSAGAPVPPTQDGDGVRFRAGGVSVTVSAAGADVHLLPDSAALSWSVTVPPRSRASVTWALDVADTGAVVRPAGAGGGFRAPSVTADDRRLPAFLEQSVADLRALRMTTPATPDDEFLAAGSPWYLTLFGRDSIWAARMLLPLGTELAGGTLRTLAARQGRSDHADTAEAAGKILHEVRRLPAEGGDPFLPPVYYGTVDATPLWVCLLADAWRWGMPAAQVAALLPAAQRALEWMVTDGDSDGDGFLEYIDKSGRGLANQGWKDSGDSIRFADGRIAAGPVALAEVQSYAYEAARAGADLLEAFDLPGADRWRRYAAELRGRFADRFWTADDLGAYPVLALDGAKRQVDAPASNMGHLLASGILLPEQAALIADRLVHPSMSSGFGLRTMSATAGGYSPLSYHCGSVWPHDTAIAIHGLSRAGFPAQAMVLAEGLLAAGAAFGGRLPELYGGFARDEMPVPVPYPASCRPQAWSAASAVVLLQSMLGLTADVPAGEVRIAPAPGVGAVAVTGLRVAGAGLDVAVDSAGRVVSARTGADVRLRDRSAAAAAGALIKSATSVPSVPNPPS